MAGNKGSSLTITGQGFGSDKTKVSVDAGGLNCEVDQLSNEEITCNVISGDTL